MAAIGKFVFLAAAMFANASWAATFTVDSREGRTRIHLEGEIEIGDEVKFERAVAGHTNALVSLNSPGGALDAGLSIGEIIRSRGLDTAVMNGKSCASACGLAWLAGTERFIEGSGRVGFHAAYHGITGLVTSAGNARVGAYVARLGLSDNAVVYVTSAQPHDMEWLDMAGAASVGIAVSFASPTVSRSVAALATRYGIVEFVRVANDDAQVRYRSSRFNIFLNENSYAHLVARVQTSFGELYIISTPSNVRGMPPTYYGVLVRPTSAHLVSGRDFGSEDGTFSFKQIGDDVEFSLGFDNKRAKSALFRNGFITVRYAEAARAATLPKADCAEVLNMVAQCLQITGGCGDDVIWQKFAMAGQRFFNSLENKPVFNTQKFYEVCRSFCLSRTYSVRSARPTLCGY